MITIITHPSPNPSPQGEGRRIRNEKGKILERMRYPVTPLPLWGGVGGEVSS